MVTVKIEDAGESKVKFSLRKLARRLRLVGSSEKPATKPKFKLSRLFSYKRKEPEIEFATGFGETFATLISLRTFIDSTNFATGREGKTEN